VTVTCQEDRSLSWQRKCVGTQWEGELGTCPGSYATGAAVNMPPAPLPIGKLAMINDFPTLLLLLLVLLQSAAALSVKYEPISMQDSIAIAKKTARCAQYMGALKSFESPHYAPGYCSRNF